MIQLSIAGWPVITTIAAKFRGICLILWFGAERKAVKIIYWVLLIVIVILAMAFVRAVDAAFGKVEQGIVKAQVVNEQ